ncbi:MAG TPA: hypothetical protein VGF53_14830 [Pseudolabrys sp.]|jgi:hypothetical protein
MPKTRVFFAVLAVVLGLNAGTLVPVSAEVAGASTQELAAQARPRITIQPRQVHPGPNAKRYCHFWLAKEYRVSGPVIVPQQHCWWR